MRPARCQRLASGVRAAGAALAVLCVLASGGCSPPRAIEAVKVLGDVAAGNGPSRLKASTPAPARLAIGGDHGEQVSGDLYWPGNGALAALVLVPGAAPEGRDDSRLVAFAHTFARAGFAVLVPEIPNLRSQRLSAADARPIARAIQRLAGCVAGPADSPVGVVAISYAAGPALLAALEPDTRELVRFVMAVGGYYDLEAVVTFFTTGYFREAGDRPWQHRTPNAYGKWVFVRANADRLDDPADRATLAAMAERKLLDLNADVADLRPQLGPEGRAVMALLDNRDPDRVPRLIAALPETVRVDLEALDLARQDLTPLHARLLLLHGRDDPIIPATESQALAAAAPPGSASLYLVDRLAHVDLGPSGLRDGLALWRATYQLLTERDAMPAPALDACRSSVGAAR